MIGEFRDFLFRGNIIDLAVAVVLGAAFGAIVASLVADIITPLLGILGIPDFSTWVIQVGSGDPPAEMRIGVFLNTLISFVLIALAIFFFVVKPMQRMAAMRGKSWPRRLPARPRSSCSTEIRDELRSAPEPEARLDAAGRQPSSDPDESPATSLGGAVLGSFLRRASGAFHLDRLLLDARRLDAGERLGPVGHDGHAAQGRPGR